MRCIFCREPSESSVSVEHVVPESLGNTGHVLPPGWVCDSCNHDMGRRVEGAFLGSRYGLTSRFEMGVGNKRGAIPGMRAVALGTVVELRRLSLGRVQTGSLLH